MYLDPYIYIYTHTHTFLYVYISTYTYIYIYTSIYTYIYSYVHIYIHIGIDSHGKASSKHLRPGLKVGPCMIVMNPPMFLFSKGFGTPVEIKISAKYQDSR